MNLHNKTYTQDNKATLAALTGALCTKSRQKATKKYKKINPDDRL